MNERVLVTGASGQLGHALSQTAPAGLDVTFLRRDALDLADAAGVDRAVRAAQPTVVINAAAYTAVDRAESDAAAASAVNATGVRALASVSRDCGARVIHVSTDFVFGAGRGRPWRTDDATDPQSVYGATKREGEVALLETLGDRGVIIRTAWVYAAHGANFVKTMLRLMRERDEVRVIADQVGTPTWATSLAHAVWASVARPEIHGIHHWTDAGVASWYDFAVAIQEEALVRGLLPRSVPVHPITTADYPTPARRPSYSVLDKTLTTQALGLTPVHWRTNLRLMLDELAHA